MRLLLCLPLILGLCACAALESDQWSWLDDPQRQRWEEVVLQAYGREVRFLIPDRRDKGGEHVRVWPGSEAAGGNWQIVASLDALQDPLLPIAQFRWDEYWQGFYKPGDRDFTLNIDAYQPRERRGLLDLNAERRMQSILDEHSRRWAGSESRFSDWVQQYYWIKTIETPHHVWVVENQPQITWRHEYYYIPLTDDIEMVFRFFVREKRWDFKDDPEWRQSRWAIVRQIMDTVRITPSPFPDEP